MLKYYVKASEAVRRLRTDKDGVVSFEYVIVAAFVVARSVYCVRTGWYRSVAEDRSYRRKASLPIIPK